MPYEKVDRSYSGFHAADVRLCAAGLSAKPKTDNTVINNLLQLLPAKSALDEMPVKHLTDGVISRAEAYSETALLVSVKNLCRAKMRTKAFLHPEHTYDDSFLGSLESPSEWTFPYSVSELRYLLNNLTNVVIYLFRYIL